MFKHIFSFEFNQWFNKPLLYIYAIILGGIGLLSMGAAGGLFDGNTATVSSIKMINSPLQLCMSLGAYSYLAYLLLPSIIGATLQKDFDSNMFKVLYSYPFGKRDYIFGKFFSAFLIAVLIFFFIGIGTYIATVLSGVDQAVVVPFDFIAYLKTYVIWIIPNIFLFSAIVFAVTLYTRSIIAGFIALTAIFFVEGMTDVLLMDSDYEKFGALIDPFGLGALNNYTKYWTIIEQNENALPVFGMVLYNRLLWIGIALGIFFATYRWFTFSYTPKSFAFWKSKDVTKSVSTKPGGIIDITLPDTNYNYGVLHGLQSAWALTKIDLKYVLKGGPFIVVSIIGVLFIIIISAVSGQILQTSTLPVTREVLMIPGTMFSLLIALLTFIYAGLLFHRPETVNVYQLEDASAAPTWSLAVSKLWSITLMQVVLLGIIMVTGIAIQIYNGYYNFEIGQYLTELYGIRLINYVNWALLAILIYNLVPNFYLGLVVCMVLGIGFQFLSQLGVEQGIYKYNAAPGLRYSDMSGYGNRLGAHFMFKIYWLALGVFFFMLSILLWRRGVRTSLWHRIKGMKKRFRPILNILLIGSFLTFMGLGGWLYYQYNVIKPYVPSKLREERSINYEKEYKHYQSVAQPKIVDVTLNIDLVPESRDIKANGTYILVNKSGTPIDTVFVETTGLVDELNFSIQADIVTYDSINNVSIYHLPNPMQPGEEIELSFSLANEPNTLFHSESPVRSNGTFFNSFSFPVIGYLEMSEVIDKKVRLKYGLAEKDVMASPEDSV
ncbi:MAG: ABC-2 type transport system permease protein, partial [Saprospiraceae bacterium]